MSRKITQEEIASEAKAGHKPLAIDSGIDLLPLSELGDREFEILVYQLVQKEIQQSQIQEYTDISLMQGIGERGRDCVLYSEEHVSGIVQCKKYKARLSRPAVLKEIVKFLLFSTLDKKILPNPKKFEYQLFVSNDLSEPAIQLIKEFHSEIQEEIKLGNIGKYIDELIEEYKSFSDYKRTPPLQDIIELLSQIKIVYFNCSDLSLRIYNYPDILTTFFNVKSVIDLENADKVIRNALDDYGLKLLTDEDLKNLQERISNTIQDDRINLGLVDFFGYSKEFFKSLGPDRFKEVLKSVQETKILLNKFETHYLNSKIQEKVLERITHKLLFPGKIHPFSVGIANPYLFQRLSSKLVLKALPEKLLPDIFPQVKKSKEKLIEEISEYLFETSNRIMQGDYSDLVGDPELVAYKKNLYIHLHQGFSCIEDAKKRFEQDMILIKPELDEIENEITKKISENKTIVIKDSSFFDDEQVFKKVLSSLNDIDWRK